MNVSSVMGKVKVYNRREVWKELITKEDFSNFFIPPSPIDDYSDKIYSGHSPEEEKTHTCSDVYVNCHPESSWEHLTSRLYRAGQMTALDQARPFLPPRGM